MVRTCESGNVGTVTTFDSERPGEQETASFSIGRRPLDFPFTLSVGLSTESGKIGRDNFHLPPRLRTYRAFFNPVDTINQIILHSDIYFHSKLINFIVIENSVAGE